MNKNEITETSGYLVAQHFNMDNGLMEELEGLTTTFDKIKIPAGGGLMFEAPGDDGEPEPIKEIEGVILHHHPVNSYYKDPYNGGSNPPDCGSYDGKTGEGTPGGNCATCPFNQFGSSDNGKGKACKNKRRIFILREGEVFPVMLSLPTGSLKEFTKYVRRLITKGKRSYSLVTKITLKKATSSTGISFSQAKFSIERNLSKDEINAVLPLVEHIKELSRSIALDHELGDYEVDEETGEVKPLR
jgi:hypothetical protein